MITCLRLLPLLRLVGCRTLCLKRSMVLTCNRILVCPHIWMKVNPNLFHELGNGLLDHPVQNGRDAKQANPAVGFVDLFASYTRPIRAGHRSGLHRGESLAAIDPRAALAISLPPANMPSADFSHAVRTGLPRPQPKFRRTRLLKGHMGDLPG